MDPTQTLTDLLAAIADNDAVVAYECAASLARWIGGGGFLPDLGDTRITRALTAARD